MMLTKKEILDEIKEKRLKIEPFNRAQIGPVSIDLTLSNEFRTIISENLNINSDYKKISKKLKAEEITLKPGAFILGITKEKIKLPENVCGLLQGRSRYARLGLLVHVSASVVQPGVNNKQVLEIKNLSNSNLKLKAGTKICQLILMRTESNVKYKGKFKNQTNL